MKKFSLAKIIDCILILVAIAASVIIHFVYKKNIEIDNLDEIVNSLLLYLSITIGFFGTSISVLISIMEKEFMKRFFFNENIKNDFIRILYTIITAGTLSILTSVLVIIFYHVNINLITNVYFLSFYVLLIIVYSLNLLYMIFILLIGLNNIIKNL